MFNKKVTIVGAGNVGATAAMLIPLYIPCEICLLDIKKDYAEGKAMDINQALIILDEQSRVIGSTSDYSKTANSDIVIITSGVPRKPGMSREELVGVNSGIVKEVLERTYEYSPNAIFIIVSNPMDTMTYLAHKVLKKVPSKRIIGMGGTLDSGRFNYFLQNNSEGIVIGGHGDKTMIPLVSLANQPDEDDCVYTDEAMQEIVTSTMNGGATLTSMLGTSAWMGPAAAITKLVHAILNNEDLYTPCSVYLYIEDVCIGLPCVINREGIQSIDYNVGSEEEHELLKKSIEAVKNVNKLLPI